MKRYVLGLMFTTDHKSVVLVRKARPAWQAGKLNGVGGLIEEGEEAIDAMIREFHEETGADTVRENWVRFGILSLKSYAQVILFRGADDASVQQARTRTDEEVRVVGIEKLTDGSLNQVPNLVWLVHAAKDYDSFADQREHPFKLEISYLQ